MNTQQIMLFNRLWHHLLELLHQSFYYNHTKAHNVGLTGKDPLHA